MEEVVWRVEGGNRIAIKDDGTFSIIDLDETTSTSHSQEGDVWLNLNDKTLNFHVDKRDFFGKYSPPDGLELIDQ